LSDRIGVERKQEERKSVASVAGEEKKESEHARGMANQDLTQAKPPLTRLFGTEEASKTTEEKRKGHRFLGEKGEGGGRPQAKRPYGRAAGKGRRVPVLRGKGAVLDLCALEDNLATRARFKEMGGLSAEKS